MKRTISVDEIDRYREKYDTSHESMEQCCVDTCGRIASFRVETLYFCDHCIEYNEHLRVMAQTAPSITGRQLMNLEVVRVA